MRYVRNEDEELKKLIKQEPKCKKETIKLV